MNKAANSHAAAATGLAALTAFVMRQSLAAGTVATGRFNDIAAQFAEYRRWGFSEMAEGRFPLWNPFAFGGQPFHGSVEPGLLYPPNWLHLFLPLELALNASLFLHVWLAGLLTYAWARRQGVSARGAFAGGVVFMFCGPLYLRLYAGHLPYLCAVAWLPGLLLILDELRRAPTPRWTGAGAAVGAMIVLAGNPQAAWLAALAAGIYAALGSPPRGARVAYMASVVGVAAGAAALSAAQWVPGLETAVASTRWGGLPAESAASFSLQLSDLAGMFWVTALSEGLRARNGFYWESCLHFGATAFLLALWASRRRDLRPAAAAASILLVLAFGPAAPVIGKLFAALPLAGLFRASGRLALPAFAFLSLLVGFGYDEIEARLGRWRPALLPAVLLSPLFFAALNTAASPVGREFPVEWAPALRGFRPGERAIFDMRTDPDAGLALGVPEVWGYGQLVSRRWAELLFALQGYAPDEAGTSLIIRREHPLLRLLGSRAVLRRGEPRVRVLTPPLPRVMLVRDWRLSSGREATLAAMLAPSFDPTRVVILETPPEPLPDPRGGGGSVRVVREESDEVELEASLKAPAILLIADSFADGWRADALPGSARDAYRVQVADHALRAVALPAGEHRFVLRYAPAAFRAAGATSLVFWAALAAWVVAL